MELNRLCLDRSRLLAEYVRSVNDWADAVRNLADRADVVPEDYRLLMTRIDAAKALANQVGWHILSTYPSTAANRIPGAQN
jgi:hypothetical protein